MTTSESAPPPAIVGVVTSSDRASAGIYEDRSGRAIQAWLEAVLTCPFEIEYRCVPDERDVLESTLRELVDAHRCSLVLTTGGTGPAARDVTPEATEAVCDKMLPGFGELMRSVSLTQVPTAILSRQSAGVRGHCLIVNLPGKPQAIDLCLDAVFAAVPYCIDLVGGAYLTTDPERIVAFRPGARKNTG